MCTSTTRVVYKERKKREENYNMAWRGDSINKGERERWNRLRIILGHELMISRQLNYTHIGTHTGLFMFK